MEVKSEKICIKKESKVETDDEKLSDSASMEDSENHCQNENSAEWTLKHPTLDESGQVIIFKLCLLHSSTPEKSDVGRAHADAHTHTHTYYIFNTHI